MIPFKLIDNKYILNGEELPVKELLSYPHEIEGDEGMILLPYKVGDHVWRYPSVLDRRMQKYGTRRVIREFTIFGGTLCVRFEHCNVPEWIECISPI